MVQNITSQLRRTIQLLVACSVAGPLLCTVPAAGQVEPASWIMYHQPQLATPKLEVRYPPKLAALWVQALQQPDLDLKRRAAATLAMAPERGVPNLEQAIPPLLKLLQDPDQPRVVRLTVAQALVALDARQAVEPLFSQLDEHDLELAEIVEPALARWSYQGATELWMKRLEQPAAFRRAELLAIQGLGTVGDQRAVVRLQDLAIDHRAPVGVRIAAAVALGQLTDSGLLTMARQLAEDTTASALPDRLIAVKMLARHRGQETEQLLAQLARDPMPSVQALALQQLRQIDPLLVMPLVEDLVSSPDANVRTLVAQSLIDVARQPVVENVAKMAPLLDDPNPPLRRLVRDALIELAEREAFRAPVLSATRQALDNQSWRGQEQAIRILVALQEKPAVERFLDLLDHPRAEVNVTAAWGLCELAVPETLGRIHDYFRRETTSRLAMEAQPLGSADLLAHLAQAMGKMNFQAADEVLRQYIAKDTPLGTTPRAAAIWALGQLYRDRPEEQLANLLAGRLRDYDSLEPEDPLVRRFAGIALGFMKAEQQLPTLQRIATREGLHASTGIASAWAIHHITGAPLPTVPPVFHYDNSWFLVPSQDSPLP